MPTVERNLETWENYDWSRSGEEWSSPWRGTEFLWWGTLLPRIHAFLPASTVLEIAPGYGRITHYLKDMCQHLVLVDLSERCIEACQSRFSDSDHITYHVNDGTSLAMIPDESVDFVFSFDSLVHAEADVLEAYLSQLSTKLSPNGIGFIHHSNFGTCWPQFTKRLPIIATSLRRSWRAESMTAARFVQFCARADLRCVSQELVNWATWLPLPVDCFSVFTRPGSSWARETRTLNNMSFSREAKRWGRASGLYSSSSFGRRE